MTYTSPTITQKLLKNQGEFSAILPSWLGEVKSQHDNPPHFHEEISHVILPSMKKPLAGQDPEATVLELTIVSREGCHLCDAVYRIARHLQTECSIKIRKVSAEADPTLLTLYGEKVPVVLIDGIERCAGKITEGDLRRAIKKARWRKPISRILSRLGYAPGRG